MYVSDCLHTILIVMKKKCRRGKIKRRNERGKWDEAVDEPSLAVPSKYLFAFRGRTEPMLLHNKITDGCDWIQLDAESEIDYD